jgi:hypothetical protein
VTNRIDRLVGQRLTLVTGDVDLHVGSLTVAALGALGGQRVAPEVLNVLDMGGVRAQILDHLVVELVRIGAERVIAFEHDHHRAAGVVLIEHLADPFGGDHRGCVVGAHGHRAQLADSL